MEYFLCLMIFALAFVFIGYLLASVFYKDKLQKLIDENDEIINNKMLLNNILNNALDELEDYKKHFNALEIEVKNE